MRNSFKASVLAAIISFGSVDAIAADAGPTVSDAHELIGELVGKGVVADERNIFPGGFHTYEGDGCTSSMGLGKASATLSINWVEISEVRDFSSDQWIHIKGVVHSRDYRNQHVDDFNDKKYMLENFTDTGLSFYLFDDKTSKRLGKAMTLLMNSCAKKSKFD